MKRALVALTLTGCVTGGNGGSGAGAVLLLGAVAQAAANGEPAAQSLWCGTLRDVRTTLAATPGKTWSAEELVESLTPTVAATARSSGYSLHARQIGPLILDAHTALKDPKASPAPACG